MYDIEITYNRDGIEQDMKSGKYSRQIFLIVVKSITVKSTKICNESNDNINIKHCFKFQDDP